MLPRGNQRELPVPGSWPLTYTAPEEASGPDLGPIDSTSQDLELTVDMGVVDGDEVASVAPPADYLQKEEVG